MRVNQLPKPNTQAVSWFFSEFQKRNLDLNPKYQRKKVWVRHQQCFLIDSLISGSPIPQVYLNIVNRGAGLSRKTIYEVVDGQQRLKAILEFMEDKWELVRIDSRRYPVSDVYNQFLGKRYSELPDSFQNLIWNYPIPVQELREWTESQIQALFRRLNIVNVGLTKQELRHSQFFGPFIKVVEQLAENEFWDDIKIFSKNDYRRMRDIEYVSELLVIVIDGIQDQQKTLDDFYAKYDSEFPSRPVYVRTFRNAIESLRTIQSLIEGTRFSKKADFYALFAAVMEFSKNRRTVPNLRKVVAPLRALAQQVDGQARKTRLSTKYHSTVIEGPNKLGKRRLRKYILLKLLSDSVR